ncbi:hypothetical protein WN55_10633 [Dufourea novaeangliae]|uniref:Uncharacterized protein n=1 Tax=Dufourea novaeangliae TaxID=178035 RepID=A0A154P441_DUFNO|nr:hypothetical protein WN55_10633 [Dufourea novaeangliae]
MKYLPFLSGNTHVSLIELEKPRDVVFNKKSGFHKDNVHPGNYNYQRKMQMRDVLVAESTESSRLHENERPQYEYSYISSFQIIVYTGRI